MKLRNKQENVFVHPYRSNYQVTKIIYLAQIDVSGEMGLNNTFIKVKNDPILGNMFLVR